MTLTLLIVMCLFVAGACVWTWRETDRYRDEQMLARIFARIRDVGCPAELLRVCNCLSCAARRYRLANPIPPPPPDLPQGGTLPSEYFIVGERGPELYSRPHPLIVRRLACSCPWCCARSSARPARGRM